MFSSLLTADQCSPSPCFNGGTCEYINEWPYFECDCPFSYSSYNCGSQSGIIVIYFILAMEGGRMWKEIPSTKPRIRKVQSRCIDAVYLAKRKGNE